MSNEADNKEGLIDSNEADHTENTGFSEAFEAGATGKPLVEEKPAESKPAESKLPERKLDQPKAAVEEKAPEAKPATEQKPKENDAPLSLDDKIKAAAEKLDAGNSAKETPAESRSVLEVLPPQYAWAKDVVANGKLADWVGKQSKTIKTAASSGDPEDAMFVLDLYKKDIEPPKAPASEQKQAQQELKSFIEEFGEVKVRAGDGKMKALKDLAGEYENSEIFEAMAAVSRAIAEKMKTPDSKGDLEAMRQRVEDVEYRQWFWDKMTDAHSDAKKLVNSGAIEKWVNEQTSTHIKRLFSSPNPDDAILVIDAYKEAKVKEAGTGNKAKKVADGLHGNSLQSKRDPKIPESSEQLPEDFDAGFEAAAKEAKK